MSVTIKIANIEVTDESICIIMERYKDAHYESTPEAIASGIAVHWYGVIIVPNDYAGEGSEGIIVTVQNVRYKTALSSFLNAEPGQDIEFEELPPDKRRKLVICAIGDGAVDNAINWESDPRVLMGSYEYLIGDDEYISRVVKTQTIEKYEAASEELFTVSDLKEGEWVELFFPIWDESTDTVSFKTAAIGKIELGTISAVEGSTKAGAYFSNILGTVNVALLNTGGDNILIGDLFAGVTAKAGTPKEITAGVIEGIDTLGVYRLAENMADFAEISYQIDNEAKRGAAMYVDIGISSEDDQYVTIELMDTSFENVFISAKDKVFKPIQAANADQIAALGPNEIYVEDGASVKVIPVRTLYGGNPINIYLADVSESGNDIVYAMKI